MQTIAEERIYGTLAQCSAALILKDRSRRWRNRKS